MQLLEYLNEILSGNKGAETYKLPDFEKKILSESFNDYKMDKTIIGNDLFKRNEKWLL
jgi:hypothetical protein